MKKAALIISLVILIAGCSAPGQPTELPGDVNEGATQPAESMTPVADAAIEALSQNLDLDAGEMSTQTETFSITTAFRCKFNLSIRLHTFH